MTGGTVNKPLTNEDRAEIKRIRHAYGEWVNTVIDNPMLDALIGSETFWREAVKNAYEHGSSAMCVFCDHDCRRHRPDCPWLLAQEAE